ncbi:uncharacterized mitochondrial protein AtMg00860-like [Puntigrus tetrazona]|uniref:uncharacterized mitochondrial protein AtMg00860-like n=1 Tax=Puntigrus tetrazona TaxID=1606681 RepID=UPI001C88E935|nr:uncharacterized mitochondrial protein AtMg00860-like [Puntigrus tetrazona]
MPDVVYNRGWEEHLHHLEAAALTANASKGLLAQEEADYLGYTVGRGNVKPQSKKVDSILSWPQPRTKKQVRTFLGLVSDYRPFIPSFATKAAPLTELTRKYHPNQLNWTKEAERAFTDLKQALCGL